MNSICVGGACKNIVQVASNLMGVDGLQVTKQLIVALNGTTPKFMCPTGTTCQMVPVSLPPYAIPGPVWGNGEGIDMQSDVLWFAWQDTSDLRIASCHLLTGCASTINKSQPIPVAGPPGTLQVPKADDSVYLGAGGTSTDLSAIYALPKSMPTGTPALAQAAMMSSDGGQTPALTTGADGVGSGAEVCDTAIPARATTHTYFSQYVGSTDAGVNLSNTDRNLFGCNSGSCASIYDYSATGAPNTTHVLLLGTAPSDYFVDVVTADQGGHPVSSTGLLQCPIGGCSGAPIIVSPKDLATMSDLVKDINAFPALISDGTSFYWTDGAGTGLAQCQISNCAATAALIVSGRIQAITLDPNGKLYWMVVTGSTAAIYTF